MFSPTHPLSDAEANRHWGLLAADNGHRKLHRLTAYLNELGHYPQLQDPASFERGLTQLIG